MGLCLVFLFLFILFTQQWAAHVQYVSSHLSLLREDCLSYHF